MAHATPGFVAGPGDELSARTLPVFFGMLELLLRAGVSTVAEAAFQDRLWRPGLEPLRALAELRVVHCVAGAEVALARAARRWRENPARRAHAQPPADVAERIHSRDVSAVNDAFLTSGVRNDAFTALG
jgi:hypothetical protein